MNNTKNIEIIIDKKEKNKRLLKKIEKKFSVKYETLKYGDYYIKNKDFYIERKSFKDLFNSFITDRADKQILNMIKNNKNFIIVVHGKLYDLYNPYKPDDLHKRQIQCEMKILNYILAGIRVFIAPNDLFFIEMLKFISIHNLKEYTPRQTTFNLNDPDPRVKFMTGVHGIGIKKSKKLIDEYNNIPNLGNNIDNLKISKTLKESIRKSFFGNINNN